MATGLPKPLEPPGQEKPCCRRGWEEACSGGQRQLWLRPPRCPPPSLGTRGNQRSASNSVYFQVTFFKKNSFPQMLDPASGMWRGKQLSTPETLHSPRLGVGAGGASWGTGAVHGQSVEPGSGLCSQSCCVPSRALTPPQPLQGQLVLAWAPSPRAWTSGTLAPGSTRHTPGQPRLLLLLGAQPVSPSGPAQSLPQPSSPSLSSSEPRPPGSPPGLLSRVCF